jgi:PAS domain S-box-containing protein
METLFRALANAADGACVINRDQQIQYWNPAAERILGHTHQDVLGQPCYEILCSQNRTRQALCRSRCPVRTAAAGGGAPPNYTLNTQDRAGQKLWINISPLIVPADANASPWIVYLFRDVTEERQDRLFRQQVLQAIQGPRQDPFAQGNRAIAGSQEAHALADMERRILTLLRQILQTQRRARASQIAGEQPLASGAKGNTSDMGTILAVSPEGTLNYGPLQIDPYQRTVTISGRACELTAREFDLLYFMARHPRQVFSRAQLLDRVWGYQYTGATSTVTVHIRRLREKIEENPSQPHWIQTVWGVGYCFEP